MTTVLPEGQSVRQAVRWISEQTKIEPNASPLKFVSEAISKFDLSPKDSAFLMNFYKNIKNDFPEKPIL